MKNELIRQIKSACQSLFNNDAEVDLSRPDEQFGDYATNVAIQLAKQLGRNPNEVGEALVSELRLALVETVSEISLAGPGFINFKLKDRVLIEAMTAGPSQSLAGKVIVAEYSDPNPFKILHVGHIYTTVVGDAVANLVEMAGAEVHRVNYSGDVGLHVAKTMWAILKRLGGELPDKLDDIEVSQRAAWLAEAYVEGNNIYDSDEATKAEITELNKRVYKLHADNDHDSPLARIYWTCRQWSYEAFDAFYERFGTKIEKYYPESEVADLGLQMVRQQTGKVFTESDGAVVFKGEKYDLHTRVFINREGLPTYEAKEVGLIEKKHDDYNYDRSIIVTANEQEQYMAVVLKAIEQFLPELAAATIYVPHGLVKLSGGLKMSSRRGNIISATDVLDMTAEAVEAAGRAADDVTVLGAIKYAFLKSRLGGDLTFEPNESVSLEGNSGPYLQYAYARACSILRRAETVNAVAADAVLEPSERMLVRKVGEYAETVDKAANELMPHHVCTYLYELAQIFNRFYENNRVIDDQRQDIRLGLVKHYSETLKAGLELLGISAPDKM